MSKILDFVRPKERRRDSDRRQRSMPVARDRRVAVADRRGGAYAGA